MIKKCAKRTIKKEVDFKLYAPEAQSVKLAGDFNDWNTDSIPLKKDKKGIWKKKLGLLPGRHEYKFFVDSCWVEDPNCPERTTNTFGSQNCVLVVK